jgi:hypothetical protein
MNSETFQFRIPTSSRGYLWLKQIQDSGENVSRALRLLIETHSEMFDKLTVEKNRCNALRRQIATLERQDSPDFRANLEAEKNKLARIKKAERSQASD